MFMPDEKGIKFSDDTSLLDVFLQYIRHRHSRLIASWVFQFPCEVFFAWLAAVKGLPAICGIYISISGPETGYPLWLYVTWGIQMTLSSFCIALGLWKKSFTLRILGFKLLTIATIFNLLAILFTHPFAKPSYIILYAGFLILCIVKIISLSHDEDLEQKQ